LFEVNSKIAAARAADTAQEADLMLNIPPFNSKAEMRDGYVRKQRV
jgi:hypothetical protein